MTSQKNLEKSREIGRQGGHVDTNQMSSADKQATDIAVNKGKADANR